MRNKKWSLKILYSPSKKHAYDICLISEKLYMKFRKKICDILFYKR